VISTGAVDVEEAPAEVDADEEDADEEVVPPLLPQADRDRAMHSTRIRENAFFIIQSPFLIILGNGPAFEK
jgi:hypothetical protein